MKFSIERDQLLKPLQLVNGVVEKRQTLPILGNTLMVVENDTLKLTGSDLEVELCGKVSLQSMDTPGEVTVPARKLFDICRSLPEGSLLTIELDHQKVLIRSGASRFSLTTLPAADFPKVNEQTEGLRFHLPSKQLKELIDKTNYAMAQQDVRYYLNGTLWDVLNNKLLVVSTDGHRLALAETQVTIDQMSTTARVIVPRKAILEIARMLALADDTVEITITGHHIRLVSTDFVLISKLIEGRFPDYQAVIPKKSQSFMKVDRDALREVLQRVAILSNEKYRGVRLDFQENLLKVFANNPETEEAEERIDIQYPHQEPFEIGLNVNYLLDTLNTLPVGLVHFAFSGSDKSVLIEQENDPLNAVNVIMPMRL
jgi:DNA polymerase-3 subunit beta